MCGPETTFSRLSCSSQGFHTFQAKEPVHKTLFWENLEILASTASIFAQILAHKPPNLEIFSSQASKFGNFQFTSPLFQRQVSVRKPHTSEIRAAHPYLKKKKKLSAPRGPSLRYRKKKLVNLLSTSIYQIRIRIWFEPIRQMHRKSRFSIWINYHTPLMGQCIKNLN